MSVYKRSDYLTEKKFHYCPGCTHGTVHRIIADVLQKLNSRENIIGVASVGCSVFAYDYFNFDMQQAAHGRAPAVATGIKRVLPDKTVFTYQGDGDLASIGLAEIIHAAARNENNGTYGMTGGQMAPTTTIGTKTTTCIHGRAAEVNGFPIKICEMMATLDGTQFVARTSCHDIKNIINTEKMIEKAFKHQLDKKGFSLIEVMSICPTNFKMSAKQMNEQLKKNTLPHFPLGVFKKEISL